MTTLFSDLFNSDSSPWVPGSEITETNAASSEAASGVLQQISASTNIIFSNDASTEVQGVIVGAVPTTDYEDFFDISGGLDLRLLHTSSSSSIGITLTTSGSDAVLNVVLRNGSGTTTTPIAQFPQTDLDEVAIKWRAYACKIDNDAWIYVTADNAIPNGWIGEFPYKLQDIDITGGGPGFVSKLTAGGRGLKANDLTHIEYEAQASWDDGTHVNGTTANPGYNHVSYVSSELNRTVGITVVTPPNYDSSKSYGCYLFMHGKGGTENTITSAATTPMIEHGFDYMNGGGTEYFIVSFNAGDSFYLDAQPGSLDEDAKVRTFMNSELLGYLEDNWPIDTSRIVVGGFSMGMWSAISNYLSRPNNFLGCAGLSPPIVSSFEELLADDAETVMVYQPGTDGRDLFLSLYPYALFPGNKGKKIFVRTSDGDATSTNFALWKTEAEEAGILFDHVEFSGLPHAIDAQIDEDATYGATYELWKHVGKLIGDPEPNGGSFVNVSAAMASSFGTPSEGGSGWSTSISPDTTGDRATLGGSGWEVNEL